MGLCTSKSIVTLEPSAHSVNVDRASQASAQGVEPGRSPLLDEGIVIVQAVKNKAEGGGLTKSGGVVSQTAKGYLELGGKGVEDKVQTSRDVMEEGEDEEGEAVAELINFSDSEGSLRSEFLE